MLKQLFRHVYLARNANNVKITSIFNKMNSLSNNTGQNLDVNANRIVWMDMEMTGLDIEKDHIMEVSCIITDSALNVIAEGPNIVIHHSENTLKDMDEWCLVQHKKTGLSQSCSDSTTTVQAAENTILSFLKKHVTEKYSPLAGNSVYIDRLFLRKHMPQVDNYLHYRIIDVSTIKELCKRWNQVVYNNAPKKLFTHRSLEDIRESIEELKYYKAHFLKLD